jgi:hypothetical protein
MLDPNDLLDIQQAVAYSGLTKQRLYQIAEAVGYKFGGSWVFSRQKLDAYKAAPKKKGGRPKSLGLIPTPVIRAMV